MDKVLIADDEKNIRDGIKCIIDWNALGYTICGEAGNGEEALKLISSLKPSLVLIDIRMPKLSGLEVVENAIEQGFDGQFIILSGYSEFKYAQTAIKLGVSYYLTKPLDEDELTDALVRIKAQLESERADRSHNEHYMKKARREILVDLVNDRVDRNMFFPDEMNLTAPAYQVVIYENFNIEDREDMPYSFAELLKVTNNGSQTFEHFVVDDFEVIILKGSFAIEKFQRFLDHYEKTPLQKGSPMDTLFIAYGSIVDNLYDIHVSYEQARILIGRRFFCTQGQHTLGFEELPKFEGVSVKLDKNCVAEYAGAITDYIQTFSRRKVAEILYNLQEYLYNVDADIMAVRLFLTDLFLQVKENINRIYNNSGVTFPPNTEIIEYISGRRYMYEIIEYISKQIEGMMNSMGSSSRDSVLDDVLHYIDHNYYTNIKLEIIASLFGYNSAYLGKIFTKAVGESFNSYVDQVRINHAIEFLLENKMKVYEIAERVGYKNVDYFHKKFKKYVGVSPAEYRNKNTDSAEE